MREKVEDIDEKIEKKEKEIEELAEKIKTDNEFFAGIAFVCFRTGDERE